MSADPVASIAVTEMELDHEVAEIRDAPACAYAADCRRVARAVNFRCKLLTHGLPARARHAGKPLR